MTPMELISILDSGMVEELRMYYNGQCTIVNIRNLPDTMPDYQIVRLWNSENDKGISVLLADNVNTGYCDTCKYNSGYPKSVICECCVDFNNYYEKR